MMALEQTVSDRAPQLAAGSASRGARVRVRAGVQCPRCRRRVERLAAGRPVCAPCLAQLDAEAYAAQERAELAAWLSTRASARGIPDPDCSAVERRRIARLVRAARAAGVDWTAPASYATRRASDYLTLALAPFYSAAGSGERAIPRRRGRPPRTTTAANGGRRYD